MWASSWTLLQQGINKIKYGRYTPRLAKILQVTLFESYQSRLISKLLDDNKDLKLLMKRTKEQLFALYTGRQIVSGIYQVFDTSGLIHVDEWTVRKKEEKARVDKKRNKNARRRERKREKERERERERGKKQNRKKKQR